jgi:hypothetical protein
MRRTGIAAGVLATLAAAVASVVWAADLDFSDFHDSVMRDMDDAVKELDSNLGGQDAAASLGNVKVLRDGFVWAEQYFARKPEAPLGAGFARDGLGALDVLEKSLAAKDFDGANTGLRGVVKSCKACHEAYKPPEL